MVRPILISSNKRMNVREYVESLFFFLKGKKKVLLALLFELSDNKMATMIEMELLRRGDSGDAWMWCGRRSS